MITSEQLEQLGAVRLGVILRAHSEWLHALAHKEVSTKRAHDKLAVPGKINKKYLYKKLEV